LAENKTVGTAHWETLMSSAWYKWDRGEFEGAEFYYANALEEAKRLDPEYLSYTLGKLGECLEELGKYDQAEALYRSYLNDEHVHPYAHLATLLDKQGKLDTTLYAKMDPKNCASDVAVCRGYMKSFQTAMAREWRPPTLFRGHSVAAMLCVTPSGIRPLYLIEESETPKFDAAVKKAAANLKPPGFSPGMPTSLDIHFTFDYNVAGDSLPPGHYLGASVQRYKDLLGWQEHHLGKQHAQIPITLTSIGFTLEGLSPVKAEKVYRIALGYWEQLNDCQQKASTYDSFATFLESRRKYDEAVGLRTKSLAILQKRCPACADGLRTRMAGIAKDLKKLKRIDEANSYLEQIGKCRSADSAKVSKAP
jgi:tetratricopeptide (TPR) repeat protein